MLDQTVQETSTVKKPPLRVHIGYEGQKEVVRGEGMVSSFVKKADDNDTDIATVVVGNMSANTLASTLATTSSAVANVLLKHGLSVEDVTFGLLKASAQGIADALKEKGHKDLADQIIEAAKIFDK